MNFETWAPVYDALLQDFGYDRAADEHARDVLADLTTPFDEALLPNVSDATVAIVGAGPSLETTAALERLRSPAIDAVFAASTAVDTLAEHGLPVECMVTDLDKNPDTTVQLTESGTPVAVHAHGDNVEAVESVVPRCVEAYVLPTTQAEPHGPVRNFGGFTDGDRAAFLADYLGAGRLCFVGWDFDDSSVSPAKAKKLEWAERLLAWLEARRGERFDVLEGRRDAIDTEMFPDVTGSR